MLARQRRGGHRRRLLICRSPSNRVSVAICVRLSKGGHRASIVIGSVIERERDGEIYRRPASAKDATSSFSEASTSSSSWGAAPAKPALREGSRTGIQARKDAPTLSARHLITSNLFGLSNRWSPLSLSLRQGRASARYAAGYPRRVGPCRRGSL